MIPVVLIHKHGAKDDRYPLDVVIDQAHKFGNEVYLLSDSSIEENNLCHYWTRAAEFESHYVHLSGNHRAFELFCIQRWYVLAEWMKHHKHDVVMYTDSDVLLYCNVTEQYEPYKDDAFTLALGSSAATSYFTLRGLEAFLDYVDSIYIGRNEVFTEFQRIYREMQEQHLAGGISDMALFKFFKENVKHIRVGEMTEIHNGSTWDHNINSPDGFVLTLNASSKSYIKSIYFNGRHPYAIQSKNTLTLLNTVLFNSLHFQGSAKKLIREYAR